MKNISKVLITLLFGYHTLLGYSQTQGDEDFRLIKLHYQNSAGEKGVTTYSYNPKGQIYRAVWELLDSSRYSVNLYRYNELGLLTEIYREFSDSITSSEKYFYDSKKNKIADVFSRSDGVEGSTKYIYNDKNQLIEQQCSKHKGWLNGTIFYEYNDEKRIVNAVLKANENVIGTISNTYDSNSMLLQEFWDFSGKWTQTFVYEYEYTGCKHYSLSSVFVKNTCLYSVFQEDYDYCGLIKGSSYFTYDETGKITEKKFIRSDGLTTSTKFEYSSDGLLIKSYRLLPNEKQVTFFYYYNDEDKLIKRKYYEDDINVGFENYFYNIDGILIKAEWKNFDKWLSGSISFESDRYGRISKGYFAGENDFNAEIFFKYEDYNNTSEIRWIFTNGKYQTYNFSYKSVNVNSPH